MDGDLEELTEETLYVRLAEAIADAKGVNALDLDPLYNAIDAEAVARIITPTDKSPTARPEVTFTVSDCTVTVTAAQTINVVPQTVPSADD